MNNLVTIGTFPTEFEAGLARNLLAANGVKSFCSGGVGNPLWDGLPGGCILQIAESQHARAVEVLNPVKRSGRETDRERLATEEAAGPLYWALQAIDLTFFGAGLLIAALGMIVNLCGWLVGW